MKINLNQSPSIQTTPSINGALDFYHFGIQQSASIKSSFEFDISYSMSGYQDFLTNLNNIFGDTVVPFVNTYVGIANVQSTGADGYSNIDVIRGINLESYGTRYFTYHQFVSKLLSDYSALKAITLDIDQTNNTVSVYDGLDLVATRTDAFTTGQVIPFVYTRLSFAVFKEVNGNTVLDVPFDYAIEDLPAHVQPVVSNFISSTSVGVVLSGTPLNIHTGFVSFDSLGATGNLPGPTGDGSSGGTSGGGIDTGTVDPGSYTPVASIVPNSVQPTGSFSITDVQLCYNTIIEAVNQIPNITSTQGAV